MTPEELTQEIYDHFHESGEWPLARALQLKHRRAANIRVLARHLGWDRGGCNDGPDGRCVIQLREIANCKGSHDDLERFVSAIQFIARSSIDKGTEPVTSEDLSLALGLSELDTKRLGGLLYMAGGLWSSGSWQPDNSKFYMQPTENALFFEDVRSIDDYFAMEDRLRQDQVEGSHPFSKPSSSLRPVSGIPTPPTSRQFFLRDEALRALLHNDMGELERLVDVGAWKATAILAGSCIEALLLDLWKRDEDRALAQFGDAWPNGIAAHQLASAAVRQGLLSDDQGKLVSVLRRSRNLVHPAASVRSPEPTEQLGRALVAILNLLLADLTFSEPPGNSSQPLG